MLAPISERQLLNRATAERSKSAQILHHCCSASTLANHCTKQPKNENAKTCSTNGNGDESCQCHVILKTEILLPSEEVVGIWIHTNFRFLKSLWPITTIWRWANFASTFFTAFNLPEMRGIHLKIININIFKFIQAKKKWNEMKWWDQRKWQKWQMSCGHRQAATRRLAHKLCWDGQHLQKNNNTKFV